MVLIEKRGNLFNAGADYSLCHCISSDYALGAGIAVDFQRKYHLKDSLSALGKGTYPDCIYTKGVFNLVTKKSYWHKPTYQSLESALLLMRELVLEKNITKIAMPKIGCGLDRLQWSQVKEILNRVFKDLDIEIAVYSL